MQTITESNYNPQRLYSQPNVGISEKLSQLNSKKPSCCWGSRSYCIWCIN